MIEPADTPETIAACYPALRELRPHLDEATFVERVMRQRQAGYVLLRLAVDAQVVAVAGYRIGENLSRDRHLYVDDFVTRAAHRRLGHGRRLWERLLHIAREAGCGSIHLDSGETRTEAHSFYETLGLRFLVRHYSLIL